MTGEALTDLLRDAGALVYALLALLAVRYWRRSGEPSTRWAALSMTTLTLVALSGPVLARVEQPRAVDDVTGILLLAFCYCGYRFAASFRPSAPGRRAALVGFVVSCALILVAPPLEPPSFTSLQLLQVAGAMTWLSAVLIASVVLLLRAGRGQPGVTRRRMQLLAVGWGTFNVIFLLLVVLGDRATLLIHVLGLFGIGLFMLGLQPPAALRRTWREREEQVARASIAALMAAESDEQVAAAVLPPAVTLVGGRGAVLLDADGGLVGAHGLGGAELQDFLDAVRADGPLREGSRVRPGRAEVDAGGSRLAVRTGSAAPAFDHGELSLLASVGGLAGLALERVRAAAEVRTARDELARATEELSALVYGISHDLRNPIVTVLGYLALLEDEGALDELEEEPRHFLDRIRVSTLYMDALIRDLLELSRVGRAKTSVSDVDLGALALDIADDLRSEHPLSTIEVERLPVVRMNDVRARQLLTNLMDNALRHGGRPDLHLRVTGGEEGGDRAVVRVVDDGVGIPPEHRDRVFGIFERLDGSYDAGSGGTGIGLAMCRKIVDQVDGALQIEPTEVGTTFILSLPLAARQPADAQEAS